MPADSRQDRQERSCPGDSPRHEGVAEVCRSCDDCLRLSAATPYLCFCASVPRRPRAHFVGGLFHVTSSGNRGSALFLDDLCRERFIGLVELAVAKFEWRCVAYCLMTTHFHLAVDMEKPKLSAGMHWLNTCYAGWFNRRYGFKGHLFEDRFYSVAVEREAHMLEMSRYIVLNPVRAGICRHPGGWRWSSYRATVGRKETRFLSPEPILELFGKTRHQAREAYEAFILAGIGQGQNDRVPGTVPGTGLD